MTLRLNPRGSAVLAAFSAVALSCIATAQVYQGPIDPVPATYFGMHFHNLDAGTPWPSGLK